MGNLFTAISIGLGLVLVGVLLELFRVTLRSIRRRLSLGKAAIKVDTLPVDLETERREHRKVAIHWPVRLESAGRTIQATARDISLGGAFVACDPPLDLNERFQMSRRGPRPAAAGPQRPGGLDQQQRAGGRGRHPGNGRQVRVEFGRNPGLPSGHHRRLPVRSGKTAVAFGRVGKSQTPDGSQGPGRQKRA